MTYQPRALHNVLLKKRVTNIKLFKGKAEHAAYGPVLSKPFVRFESSLHSFFNSRQRYTNQTNKTSSATSTRQTGQQILPQQGQQQPQPSAATNRRKIQTSGIAGDKGNRRGFKQTTGRGSARPQNASPRRGELIHPPSITRSWGACRSPHARQNSAMRCGPCPWAAK